MSSEMSDKVVIVTGAAGGVGRAVTNLLRGRGAFVVAEDLNPSLGALYAGDEGVVTLVGDVASAGVAAEAVRLAVDTFGRLDGLVNNAGRFLSKSIAETTTDEWDSLMVTNVRGGFLHTQAVVPALDGTAGSIVNVTSISGLVGLPDQFAYTASKGAIVQMTRTAAVELAPSGIRVNAVAPGAINTGFMDEAMAGNPDREGTMKAIATSHPLNRIAEPEDVAEAIVFLLSDRARAITGAILPVDGGFTAQ
jgi:NAD(P)-dependent dehydrogenase (short-subunit alcohol dehydrogenase family)